MVESGYITQHSAFISIVNLFLPITASGIQTKCVPALRKALNDLLPRSGAFGRPRNCSGGLSPILALRRNPVPISEFYGSVPEWKKCVLVVWGFSI